MKSSTHNQLQLSCDGLPLPVVVHERKSGAIVKVNRAAKKVFGLTGSHLNIKMIRPDDVRSRSAKSSGYADLGSVFHQTLTGKKLKMTVLRKKLVWRGKDCWIDVLKPVDVNHTIKNQITQYFTDAFISIDENQLIYDWNRSAEKIFGWKKKEAIGRSLVDLIIPDAHKKNHVGGLDRFVRTGEHKILNKLIEISARHKKGVEFPIELAVTSAYEDGRLMFYAFVRDISSRKKNEQRRREIEEKLNRAQAIAHLGSWEMYGDDDEIHWSDEFYRLHGLEPQSVTPSTSLRLKMTHPQDRPKLQKAIEQAMKQSMPYSLEKRIIQPNGEIRWILSEGEATLDENGKRKVFGTLIDITDRKKAEEDLQRLNAGLSETLIFGKMGSAELDLKTNEITISKELLILLDMNAGDTICTHVDDFLKKYVVPEYLPRIYKKITDGIGTDLSKKVVEVEFEMITATGRRIWIAAKGIFKEQVALGILQDITDRKKTSQQISNLTDTIPDGFIYEYWQSEDGSEYKLNYVSQGCEKLFEVSMSDALKNANSLFSKIHPDDVTSFFKLVDEKRKVPGKFDVDYRIVMEDSRVKWVNGRANVRILSDKSTIIEGIALDITRKKNLEQDERRAQALLVQSENNLRAMLNASTDFTVFLDTSGNVRLANARAKTTIHWLVDNDLNTGDHFPTLLPKDFQEKFLQNFNEAVNGQIIDSETTIELKRKEVSWLQLRFLPVRNQAGGIIGVSFNATDITKRKRAELALKKSEERLQILYNHSPVMLHSINHEGKLIRVSDYWLQKMGYTRSEVLGRRSTDFLTPVSQKIAVEEILPTFFKTGTLQNIECDFVTKNGEILSTLLSARGERNEAGEVVKSLAVVTDITEKKKLEKEVEKLAMIASRTSNSVVFTDANGCITWVNDGFERITEFKRNEAMGKKPGELLQGRETSLATIKYMRSRLEAGEGFKVDILNYTKSGKEYWLDLEVMPVCHDDGTLTGFMAIQSDITVLKLAVSEVLNSHARLQTMMNNAPMVVYMKDLQGRYTFYNHAYQKIHIDKPLRAGHTDFDLLDIESATLMREKDQQVTETKLPVSYEHSMNGRQYYTVEFPIVNVDERIYALGGISVDLTERKQAENALLQSEANLKSVVENSDTAFVLLDREFRILSFNQIASRLLWSMTGKKVVEGDHALNFVSENRKQAIEQYLYKTLTGSPSGYEMPFVIDGQSSWLHTRFFPVFNNKVVTGVIFAMSDITARKTAEAEISQSRERLKLISDNLPSVAIYQYEVQPGEWLGQYKYYSVGVEKIAGITAEELLQDPGVFEERIHPEERVEKESLVKAAVENHTVFTQDYRFQHKNGEWKWLRTRSQPTFLEDGKVVWNGMIIDITEQRQSEQSLRESEQRFRTMADAAPVLIWVSGKDKLCDYFNKGWLDFTGRSLEQELGNGWAEGVHPEDLERCVSIYESSFDQRKDFAMDYRLRRHDGQYRWIVDCGTPRFAPNGEFAGYIGSCFDIHDLVETRKKLSENEVRLRTILETEPECVKILNANGELLEMNKAGLDMVEATSLDQVVGKRIIDIVDKPFQKDFHALNQRVFRGDSGMLEFSMTGIKGTSRWLETHAVPMRDASGKITSLLGVTRDVTSRKKAEETLRESEERYRKLFELNPVPTWIFDLESLAFLQVNNAAIDHYGYSREEFLDMTILDIRPVEDHEPTITSIREFREHSEGRSYRFWSHRKKDGSLIDVEVLATNFLFEGRKARLVTINDVTSKLLNEKKLLDTLHDKDLLIKEIHHRVKNNLQLISSILYIRMAVMKQGDVRTFLEETRQKIRSVAVIHERLLQTESVNQVDIADYLNKLILDLQMTTPSHERIINLVSYIEPGYMSLDMAINCGLILNELVTNAVKHAFKDRPEGTIRINLRRNNGKFEFEISDDGSGMPESVQLGSGGFGMQLLDVFIKQLKGQVKITRVNGTCFHVVF